MTRQIVQTGTNANDGTGDTLRQAGRKINDNFEELYDFLGTEGVLSQYLTLGTGGLEFGNANVTTLVAPAASSAITINLPGVATTLVGNNTTDTLSNKTLDTPTINTPTINTLKIDDAGDDHVITIVPGDVAADTNINIPVLNDSDTLVFVNHAADLTNKRLIDPYVKGSLFDSADNELLEFTKVNSAALHLNVHNSTAAGNLPKITAAGQTNTNIGVEPTGTGAVRLGKVAFNSRLIETSSSDSDTNEDTIIYVDFSNTNRTIKLDDGTVDGEWKVVHNKTTGTSVVTVASNTSQGITLPGQAQADGLTVTLGKNDVAQFMWDNVDQTWRFIGGADSASSLLI